MKLFSFGIFDVSDNASTTNNISKPNKATKKNDTSKNSELIFKLSMLCFPFKANSGNKCKKI